MTPPTLSPSRALVWGATGFIGGALVSRLIKDKLPITIVSRRTCRQEMHQDGDVRWLQVDPAGGSPSFWKAALDDVSVIYNLAGVSGAVSSNLTPAASLDGNCRIQLAFLEGCAASRRQPHVVFASSRLVYGRTHGKIVTEDVPPSPLSMYAAHKLCVEHYHQIYASRETITFTICRISNPFGPDARAIAREYGLMNILITRALSGLPLGLYGNGSQKRDYLYIADLVEALLLCGSRPGARNEILNIGRGVSLSLAEAARHICVLTGATIQWLEWPAAADLVESGDYVVDISKAGRCLGFSCRYDFVDGLRATIGEVVRAPIVQHVINA